MDRTLILAVVGVISLIWGVYDLRKESAKGSAYQKTQSWAQIVAGIAALAFSLLNWLR